MHNYCHLICHANNISVCITSYLASSPLRRPMFWAVSVIWGSRLEGSPICGFCSYTPFIFSSASLISDGRRKVLLFWICEHWLRKFLFCAALLIRTGGTGRSFYKLEGLLKGQAVLLYMTLVRSGTDDGWKILARSSLNSPQSCWMGLKPGLCADQSRSSTPNWENYFFLNLALCPGVLSCWNRKGPSPNSCHQIRNTLLSKISPYAAALKFPLTETKSPNSNHQTQPQTSSTDTYTYVNSEAS